MEEKLHFEALNVFILNHQSMEGIAYQGQVAARIGISSICYTQ